MLFISSYGKNVYIDDELVGYISSEGTLYANGHKFGELSEEGDIYLNGEYVGFIEDNGEIYIKNNYGGYLNSSNDLCFDSKALMSLNSPRQNLTSTTELIGLGQFFHTKNLRLLEG